MSRKPKKLSSSQQRALALAASEGLMRLAKESGPGVRWQTTNGTHLNRRTVDVLVSRGLIQPNGDPLFGGMTQTFGAADAVSA